MPQTLKLTANTRSNIHQRIAEQGRLARIKKELFKLPLTLKSVGPAMELTLGKNVSGYHLGKFSMASTVLSEEMAKEALLQSFLHEVLRACITDERLTEVNSQPTTHSQKLERLAPSRDVLVVYLGHVIMRSSRGEVSLEPDLEELDRLRNAMQEKDPDFYRATFYLEEQT